MSRARNTGRWQLQVLGLLAAVSPRTLANLRQHCSAYQTAQYAALKRAVNQLVERDLVRRLRRGVYSLSQPRQ